MSLETFSAEGRLPASMRADDQFALYAIFRDIRKLFTAASDAIDTAATTPPASTSDSVNARVWQYIINSSGSPLDLGLGGGSSAGSTGATTKDSTTWSGRQLGIIYTGTGAAGIIGLYGAPSYFRVGSAADGGGINFYCFGRVGSVFATTAGLMVGLVVNPSAMSATPGSAANHGFMAAYIDAGSSNWKLGVRDRAGSVNSFDTGIAWATGQHYAVHVLQPKGNAATATISLRIFNATTGATTSSATHDFTTGFPSSSDELYWQNVAYTAAGTDKIEFFRALAIVNDGAFTDL